MTEKAQRNDPCPCGSGKKYKKCCLEKDASSAPAFVAPEFAEPERGTPDDDGDEIGGEPIEFGDEPIDRMGLHPYAVARFVEQEQASGGIKRAAGFATLSQVAALSTDAIEARLRTIGIDPAREKFLGLAAQETSAWKVGDRWLDALGAMPSQQDVDFVGLAACQLWKRWCPERPSVEMLDDWIEEGYEELEENSDPEDAARVWLRAWATIRERLTPEMRTFDLAESVYDCSYNLGEWLHDLAMSLVEGAEDSRELATQGIEILSRVVAQFADEDKRSLLSFAADRADLMIDAGREPEALAVYEQLLRDHPTEAAGYVRFAEVLMTRDARRSAELLKIAKKKKGARDWGIPERLKAVKALVDDEDGPDSGSRESSE